MSLAPLPLTTLRSAALAVAAAATLAACPGDALAEKADRGKPMLIEADKPGTADLARQVVTFNGNVTIAQGTLLIRAEKIEIRESSEGFRTAVALGSAERPASYRQKRDTPGESVEGSADRIEYDARTGTLRFAGNATVKRLRGAAAVDEISGATITWDNSAEFFSVQGGTPSAGNPSGRVRAVLSPRTEPASAPQAGAQK